MGSGQVSLRPLSADAAARISPRRMRHFNSAPGDFRRQHSVLSKYDAQLMRSRTAGPDFARSVQSHMTDTHLQPDKHTTSEPILPYMADSRQICSLAAASQRCLAWMQYVKVFMPGDQC